MRRSIVERPLISASRDQSMNRSGVVGSAHPPEFSTARAQALGYMEYLWLS